MIRMFTRMAIEGAAILAVCAGLYALAELVVWGRVR